MNDFTVSNVVVCDDARKEITNKDILIGVYASGLNLATLPTQIALCFWMEIIPKKVGKLSIEFRVDLPGKQAPVQIRIEAEVNKADESFGVFTPQLPYLITQDGELKLFARPFGHEKWKAIRRIKVNYQPPSFPAPSL